MESGKFYELLQALTGEPSRDKIKTAFLVYLFSRLDKLAIWKLPLERVFKEQFPKLAALVAVAKNRSNVDLSNKLQGLEAGVVIGKIVPICASLGLPILTIHDSILTTKEHVATVKGIIETEFAREFQVSVTVKTKCDPERELQHTECPLAIDEGGMEQAA